jgi:hypothetical protein
MHVVLHLESIIMKSWLHVSVNNEITMLKYVISQEESDISFVANLVFFVTR